MNNLRVNSELRDALDILGKERGIPRDALFEAIESSLLTACRNHFGKSDNCVVEFDKDTYNYWIYQIKTVVEDVVSPADEISLPDALMIDSSAELGSLVRIPVDSQKFGRISTQNAKGVIKQKIREEERNSVFREFIDHEHGIMTGIVQKINGRNITINLGKADAILTENEQIKGEILRPNQRVKVYLTEVRNNPRGPRIMVSRTHPDLVRCLFAEEVQEIRDGTVEVMEIAREAGSRTKMAVVSHDENVDPVGSCVGVNGIRVSQVVDELGGEKIDIINWDENPAFLIENALSPAKVICVVADEDSKAAVVIVPDMQLSLAIGMKGQNARLAAKLTGYKIDIKSESQAEESGLLEELGIAAERAEYGEEEYAEEYEEGYGGEYGEGSDEDYGDGYGESYGEGCDGEYAGESYEEPYGDEEDYGESAVPGEEDGCEDSGEDADKGGDA